MTDLTKSPPHLVPGLSLAGWAGAGLTPGGAGGQGRGGTNIHV